MKLVKEICTEQYVYGLVPRPGGHNQLQKQFSAESYQYNLIGHGLQNL